MKRKTSEVPTLVYTYGVHKLSPETAKIVHDQVFLAHRYRNQLVEIERERRSVFRAVVGELSPKLGKLQKSYDAMRAKYLAKRLALSDVRKSERGESPVAAEVRDLDDKCKAIYRDLAEERSRVLAAHVDPARAEMDRLKKARVAQLKEAGDKLGPHTLRKVTASVRAEMRADKRWSKAWRQIDASDADADVKRKAARSRSGLFHGTYAAVEDAAMRSFRESQFDPRFTSFDRTGKVGVQVTGRVSVSDAVAGGKARVTIHLGKKLSRGRQFATAKILLGLDRQTRERVYIDVPFLMHRPLPESARIRWVYLKVDRVGLRTKYELQFTIEVARSPRVVPKSGLVAINLGWRRMPDGSVRVATTHDGKREDEVRLPAKLWDEGQWAERWLGHADDHFNAARAIAHAWVRGKLPGAGDVSGSDRSAMQAAMGVTKLASVAQWRAHGKLARLSRVAAERFLKGADVRAVWRAWRDERMRAGLDLFASFEDLAAWFLAAGCERRQLVPLYLEWWRRKDAHLINAARSVQRRTRLHRREIYRVLARQLADRYRSVAVEKWNKSLTAELPTPERDTRSRREERASGVRQFAGVSVLSQAIKLAFGAGRLAEVPPDGISRVHQDCGGALSEAVRHTEVVCDKCGRMVDQDANAARALWLRAQGSEQSGDGESAGGARGSKKRSSSGKMGARRDRVPSPMGASI